MRSIDKWHFQTVTYYNIFLLYWIELVQMWEQVQVRFASSIFFVNISAAKHWFNNWLELMDF